MGVEILQYVHYRDFLKDLIEEKKTQRKTLSFRQLAQKAGLKSPNYLQMVIRGERSLTPATGERIAKVLQLNFDEIKYFVSMIQRDEARNPKEREDSIRALRIVAKQLTTRYMTKAQGMVLSSWQHLLVRELVMFPDFIPTGKFISEKLNNLITPDEAMESLEILIKSGFLKSSPEGQWKLQDPVLSSGVNIFTHELMQKYHAMLLHFWANNLEKMNAKEQELHCLNIPISSAKIPELQARVREFQDELIGWLQDEKKPDALVQLGTYLLSYNKDTKK